MLVFLVMPYFVFAVGLQDASGNLSNIKDKAGFVVDSEESLYGLIGGIINVVLGFLGIILVMLLLYAGFNWMTAAGDSAKVDTAQDTIKRAVIGIIIVVSAYGIAKFVIGALLKAQGNTI